MASDVNDLNDTVDHVRGPRPERLIVESGDYECPYSRHAYRQIQQLEDQLGGEVRFAWQHFSLTDIHQHAFACVELREQGGRVGDALRPAERSSPTTAADPVIEEAA